MPQSPNRTRPAAGLVDRPADEVVSRNADGRPWRVRNRRGRYAIAVLWLLLWRWLYAAEGAAETYPC